MNASYTLRTAFLFQGNKQEILKDKLHFHVFMALHVRKQLYLVRSEHKESKLVYNKIGYKELRKAW